MIIKPLRSRFFLLAFIATFFYYFIGVSDYIYAKNIEDEFDYPLNVNIKPLIDELLMGREPSVQPINYYPYTFLTNSGKCVLDDKIDLLILVKSAMANFDQRNAIRNTWGREDIKGDKKVKLLFFIGRKESQDEVDDRIYQEITHNSDIIVIDFIDSYYNNTIKTMMAFRWAFTHCSEAKNYLFSDDDMYVSVHNLFKYLDKMQPQGNEKNHLFAGYKFESRPLRHRSSKWRVSLEEYPWNRWPPYITAGAYVLSNESLKTIYLGSLFVKHFRFDDIFLGIVAKKVGIDPIHCSEFYYFKKPYSKAAYKDVIASHGYGDTQELMRVWWEQTLES